MTNKKQILTGLTVIIILLIPSTEAFFIKNSTNEQNEIPKKTGSVYGSVGYAHRPGYTIVPFARVWIGLKWDISDLQGAFNISELPVERHYTMYYTALGFVTKSLEVYVGGINPHEKVWPCFNEDDRIKYKNIVRTEKFQSYLPFLFLIS